MPAILLTLRSGCSQKQRGAGGVSISVSLWREHMPQVNKSRDVAHRCLKPAPLSPGSCLEK